MSSGRSLQHGSKTRQEGHVHYHYHYHYPVGPQEQAYGVYQNYPANNYCQNSQRYMPQPNQHSSLTTRENEWKRHLNPEVSKLYNDYQVGRSRFSEYSPKISEEDEGAEITELRRSDIVRNNRINNFQVQDTPLSKLDQLYFVKKQMSNREAEKNKSEITNITDVTFNEQQKKRQQYDRQIQRLKMIEQECIYLRNKFYKHFTKRHAEEIKEFKL